MKTKVILSQQMASAIIAAGQEPVDASAAQ